MADRRSLGSAPVVKDVGLFADGAQKAVAHLAHEAVRAASLALVLAGAEINACAAD